MIDFSLSTSPLFVSVILYVHVYVCIHNVYIHMSYIIANSNSISEAIEDQVMIFEICQRMAVGNFFVRASATLF